MRTYGECLATARALGTRNTEAEIIQMANGMYLGEQVWAAISASIKIDSKELGKAIGKEIKE